MQRRRGIDHAGDVQNVNSPPRYEWIDTRDGLNVAAKRMARADAIGLDTEADSFYHYFHKCCLLQICDGERVYLIDVLAVKDPDPLKEIFASPRIDKILHAAEQDVLYLKRDFGFDVHPIFDTMTAAQLLGKPSVGLAGLLQAHFGSKLDKGCQRDDWSRRPLSERQKTYAAADVLDLIPLRKALHAELVASDRLEWALEEFEVVAHRSREPREFDAEDFWGLKGARDLEPQNAAILRELYVMRDERARAADLPPFRIVSDATLVALATRAPRSGSEMEGIKGFTPLVRRRIGTLVLEAIKRGCSKKEVRRPKSPRGSGRRRTATFKARVDRLRAWRKTRSAALGLDPGVLFPQSTLEALAATGLAGLEDSAPIPGLRQWRRRLLLPEATTLLA